jgi:hypothetical protein
MRHARWMRLLLRDRLIRLGGRVGVSGGPGGRGGVLGEVVAPVGVEVALLHRVCSLRTASAPSSPQRTPVMSSRSPMRWRPAPSITPVAIGQPLGQRGHLGPQRLHPPAGCCLLLLQPLQQRPHHDRPPAPHQGDDRRLQRSNRQPPSSRNPYRRAAPSFIPRRVRDTRPSGEGPRRWRGTPPGHAPHQQPPRRLDPLQQPGMEPGSHRRQPQHAAFAPLDPTAGHQAVDHPFIRSRVVGEKRR